MTQTDLPTTDDLQNRGRDRALSQMRQAVGQPDDPQEPQGPDVPAEAREYQGLLEKAKAGDADARGQLRRRLMDPATDAGTRQQITTALQAGGEAEVEEVKKQPDRYRPAWFGTPDAQVSLGRLRNAETLGRTKMAPEFLERRESGAAGVIESYAESFVLPPARAISIALGIPDVDVEQRTKELQNEIGFMEGKIIPKAVQSLKDGHTPDEIIAGLAQQGIEADREFGKAVDAAFTAEGIDTEDGYTRLFSSPGELFIESVKQLPEEEASWAMVKDKTAKAVPFLGTYLESATQAEQEDAINRVADGKGTEEDKMFLEAMLIDQYRARSTGYKAVEGIIDMVGFGADLYSGGVVAKGLGKAASLLPLAAKAVGAAKFQKALANVAAWSNKTPTSLLQRATRGATRGAMEAGRMARQTVAQVGGEALGSAAVTKVAGDETVFGRAELETKRQQIFESISGGIDPQTGKFFMAADRIPQDAPEVTLPNAVGLLVDVAVEKLGRFVQVPGIGQTPAVRRRMLDSLARAVDPAKADRLAFAIQRGASKLEIDGIVGEILEEYASRTGMAAIGEITGNEEYGQLADIIPAGEAIADEFIAIASGAGLMQGLKAGSAAVAAAGVTPRGRERLARRIEYMRDVEAAATDPAAAERVRQANESTRRATGEEIDAALEQVGGTRAERPEGPEAEEAAELAARLGIELVFYDGPAGDTGFYNRNTPSTIFINANAEDLGAALEIDTTVHEIAHDMEAVMGEESFGTLVDKLREADAETWERTKLDARDEIGEVFGEGVFEPVGAAETSEAAATRAEDNGVLVNLLLRSRDARQNLQRILQSDQSLLQKARDGVRNLFAVLPGVKSAKAKGMERLRAALERRGLQGAELDVAVEEAALTTADEVSAAMLDVFQMREMTRARQKRAAEAGVELTDEQAYGSDEEFEEAVAETEPPADGFGEGVVEEEEAALPTPQPLPKPVLGTLDPAREAAPQRTLAQVEAELADIKRKGKNSTVEDRRRRQELQEEARVLREQTPGRGTPFEEMTYPELQQAAERLGVKPTLPRGMLLPAVERAQQEAMDPLLPQDFAGVEASPQTAGAVAEVQAETARREQAEQVEGQPLPAPAQRAAEQPTPSEVLPGAKVRINPDSSAFDETIGEKQEIAGLEVVDVTGPAGEQRARLKIRGEFGFTVVPVSELSLAQPAPGQAATGDMPFAETATMADTEAQQQTLQDAASGQTRFARRRRRRRKPRPVVINRFDEEPPTWRERQRIKWFDRLARLEKFEKDAFKKNLRLSQAESPTLAARLMPGKTTYRQEQLELNYVNPILNILAEAGISLPAFEDFLILRTTEESNRDLRMKRGKAEQNRIKARELEAKWSKPIARNLPEAEKKDLRDRRDKELKEAKSLIKEADFIDPGKDPKSFYTDEEAQAKLQALDKDPARKKQLEEAGRLVDEMNTQTRERLLEYGLITQEQFDKWTEKFEHYVPFRSDEGNSSWAEMNTAGYSVAGPESRIRRGTTRKPNPLLFSVQQAGRAIVRGEKNQVGVRAYNFFQKANMLLDVKDLEPGQEMPDLSGTARFSLKIDGEQKVIELKDEYLARALKNFGPGKKGDPTFFDRLIEQAGKLTRLMANANTQYNPDFIIINPLRDQIEAQLKVGELRERGFELSRVGLMLDSGSAFKVLRGGIDVKDEGMGEYYRRFGEAGGLIRLGDMQDYQESVAALESKLEKMVSNSSTTPVGKAWNKLMDLLSRYNRAAELAVRLGVFKQLVQGGATDAQAAAVARDITVDFNRRGQDTATINQLYMFFNATMQGTDRNIRALKTKAGKATMASLFAAGYLHSMVQGMNSDEDDDGRLLWDNEKWYNKARNIVVGIAGGKILKLPLPYFWSLPFFAGQLMESVARGAMNPREASVLMLANIANDLTPADFGSEPGTFMNTGLLVQLIPDVGRAPFELAVNRDYRGETILTPRFPGDTTPARERGRGQRDDFVSGLSEAAVDAIAAVTGQDVLDTGGPFDWNPDAVEYLIGSTAGGFGDFLVRGTKIVEGVFSPKKSLQPEVFPLGRKFIGRAALGGVSNQYFDGRQRIQHVKRRHNAMKKAGDEEAAKYIEAQDPVALKAYKALLATEKRRKNLVAKRDAAETAEERQKYADDIEALMGDFLQKFDAEEAKRRVTN